MKCPYCQKEMEKGALYGGFGQFFWLHKSYYQQHTFLPGTKEKVQAAGGIAFNSEQDIYVCRDCGKMLADIK